MIDLEQRIIDYWNAQPCNINHGKSPVGTREFFAEVSERRYRVEPHLREFSGFHLWQGKRVLEVGSGIGTDAEEFARHGAEYVGIDLSEVSIDLCRQRFDVLNLPGEFHVRNINNSVADLGEFDLIYSMGVIHHFPNIELSLQNMHKVTKTGGEMRLLVYAKNSWKMAMIQKGLDQFEAQDACPYTQAYSHEEVHQLLKEPNWKIERLRQAHNFMYNVQEYKKNNYVLEPWFEAMPKEMRDAIKEYLGWHLLIKARKI
jgi:cyclopropane fatty-acyl-phospholipid synthase-like methyltransferase